MRLIGVTGFAGSGKDTVAAFLSKRERYGADVLPFAGPLREGAAEIFGWNMAQLQDRTFKEQVDPYWGVSPREVLQWLGTDVFRARMGQDFWIRAWRRRLSQVFYCNDDLVLVPDVRFVNEAAAIHAEGGQVWRVVRPGIGPLNDHPSETEQLQIVPDQTIENSGTLDDLRKTVDDLMSAG